MTKKYYKASKELPNGEVLELRLCQSTWLATRYAPEEWTESLLVFVDDEQLDLDAYLTTDEEEAIQELLDGGRWGEYFPDD